MSIYTKWALTPDERTLYGLKLFPHIDPEQLPEKLRGRRLHEEVLKDIRSDPETEKAFQELDPEYQEALIQFCMGNRGINILYDPFFKKIFRKEKIERLEGFLSQIMGQEVRIVNDIHFETSRRSEDASMMIMDMLVQLKSGAYVNLEIQRITHDFPFKRAECYASDLLVYQYDQIHQELREENRRIKERNAGKEPDAKRERILRFDYHKMCPVYVIVLMNSSARKFQEFPNAYIHRSENVVRFDTGLEETTLKRYIYISLDIFRKLEHNELTELEAWLYFLASDRPEDIRRVIGKYPGFTELYEEIIRFRYNPKEMMAMVPEAIRMMDEGSYQLLIERIQDELKTKTDMLSELMERHSEVVEQYDELAGQNKELEEQCDELARQNREQVAQLEKQNEQLRNVIENAMSNFHLDLQTACNMLGVTVEQYEESGKPQD